MRYVSRIVNIPMAKDRDDSFYFARQHLCCEIASKSFAFLSFAVDFLVLLWISVGNFV